MKASLALILASLLTGSAFGADFVPLQNQIDFIPITQGSNSNLVSIIYTNTSNVKASLFPQVPSPYQIALNRCKSVGKNQTCAVSVKLSSRSLEGLPSPGKLYQATLSSVNSDPVSLSTRVINDKIETATEFSFLLPSYEATFSSPSQRSSFVTIEVKNSGDIAAIPYLTIPQNNSGISLSLNRCSVALKKNKTCKYVLSVRQTADSISLGVGLKNQPPQSSANLLSGSDTPPQYVVHWKSPTPITPEVCSGPTNFPYQKQCLNSQLQVVDLSLCDSLPEPQKPNDEIILSPSGVRNISLIPAESGSKNQSCDAGSQDWYTTILECSPGKYHNNISGEFCDLNQYNLFLTQPLLFGSISGSDSGLKDHGSEINLSMTLPENAHFSWTGDCSGSGVCSFEMTGVKTVGAVVECNANYQISGATCVPVQHMLTINQPEIGQIIGESSGLKNHGSIVELSFLKVEHSSHQWTGSCSGTGVCSLEMDSPKTVGSVISCDEGYVYQNELCLEEQFSPIWINSANTLLKCQGEIEVDKVLSSCERTVGTNVTTVALSYCSEFVPPKQTQLSPFGEKSYSIDNGDEIFKCEIGSDEEVFARRECDSGYSNINNSCQAPTIYFTGTDPVLNRVAIWKTDGTVAGTQKLLTISNDERANPTISSLKYSAGNIYVIGNISDITGSELRKYDPATNSLVLIKDIFAGSSGSNPLGLTEINGKTYFVANDNINGQEIWETDGTTAGTMLSVEMTPGKNTNSITIVSAIGDNLLVTSNMGCTTCLGVEPYLVNTITKAVTLLKDLSPGTSSSAISNAVYNDNKYYFRASTDAEGFELAVTDGTSSGTSLLAILNPGVGNGFLPGIVYDNKLIGNGTTTAWGTEFFSYDFVSNQYTGISDWTPGTSSTAGAVIDIVNNKLLVYCSNPTYGGELCVYYQNSFTLLKDINPGTTSSMSTGSARAVLNGKMFFAATTTATGTFELWISDGTATGTQLFYELNPGTGNGNVATMTVVK